MQLVGSTETYKLLYQGVPTVAPIEVYPATGGTTTFVKSIHAVNTSGAEQSFALYRNGVTDANRITPDIALGVEGWAEYGEDGWKVYGPVSTIGSVDTPDGRALLVADLATQGMLADLAMNKVQEDAGFALPTFELD
jgi:hypothetical protein